MVVVTSIKAARKRLRYESWHLLHLYAYLGVGLALPHQLWTGQQFLGSPGRTVFWWTAWAAAAGAVLVLRVGLPLWRSLRHGLRVTSVVREGDGVVSVYMTGRDLHALRRRARAVLHLALPRRAGLDARATPTRSPPPPTAAACGSPSRTLGDGSAATAPACGPAPGCWSRGPSAGSAPRARTRAQASP